MIDGVQIKQLKIYADDRGWLMEFLREGDAVLGKFAQITFTETYPKVIKAFHYHKDQDDVWAVPKGMIQVVLYDRREKSKTKGETQVVFMGEKNPVALKIPKGVVHGYKVLGNEPALVVYHTSHIYDPKDEFRVNYDDPEIRFDWHTQHK
ncbi:dTDP-4-dehydrorhamnose 3,5-epimerase family protein [Candidatus Berkelbacteria bacterium]|nr:dTDP-4-dehydrorhamnose 3,5-epimerase family protein [Candidatus Berkelbacteria bacterium]